MDVRMLGEGRPFVMEIMNQRAEVPGPDYFADVEKRLKEVGPAVTVHVVNKWASTLAPMKLGARLCW